MLLSTPTTISMGKLAGWRPRGHHERVREIYVMNFASYKRGDREFPTVFWPVERNKESSSKVLHTRTMPWYLPFVVSCVCMHSGYDTEIP